PNWAAYSRPQNAIDKLNFDGVSVVVYSFLKLNADGSVSSSDAGQDAMYIPKLNQQVRNNYPDLLTSIAVGGWSQSQYFSTVAANETLSKAFASNIHQYMDQNGFDGVDIDYEYPGGGSRCNVVSPDDAENTLRFLTILREELRCRQAHFLRHFHLPAIRTSAMESTCFPNTHSNCRSLV
ncbi:glycoside hydrolase superfamily, partial [Zopfochytrium polystomum]